MATDFEIRCETHDDALIVAVQGELDISSSPALERALVDAQSTHPHRLVIDLTGLEFMDSSGLHTIIRAHHRAQAESHQLALVRGPRQVQLVFELSGTADSLAFEDPVPAGSAEAATRRVETAANRGAG